VISGVILAAGTSSRLGRPKQLLDLGGRPVLRHVVDAALASPLEDVVVVLGHRAPRVAAAALSDPDPRIRQVVNDRFAEGQSTSLAAGLRSLGPSCEAAVVLLGDQPGIQPQAIAEVTRAFRERGAAVVQAAYGGRPGHPTLLSRRIWSAVLTEATGDQGAAAIIAANPVWVLRVELGGDPPADLDTEADYERLRSQFDQGSQ
jgi:molybdenum cofactor cytidylyltransferase